MIKKERVFFSAFVLLIVSILFSCKKDGPTEDIEPNPTKQLVEIKVTESPSKIEYTIDETLNIDGLIVTGKYSDGSSATLKVKTEQISGFTSSKASENLELTVAVNELTTTFSVKIIPLRVSNGVVTKLESDIKDLTLPSSIKSIAKKAFQSRKIDNLIINEGLISIDEFAFIGANIGKVKFPKTLTTLGIGAFYSCSGLSDIDLSKTALTTISEECFTLSSVKKITLPSTITKIESQAFLKTGNLTGIELPYGVTYIGNEAFRESAITKISLPNSIHTFGQRAFYLAASLEIVETFGQVKEYNLELNECVMGHSCFEGCSALKAFSIPSGVKVLGQNILSRSSELTNLTIGSNIKKISFSSMANSSLTNVTIKSLTPPSTEIISSAWYGFPSRITSIKVPAGTAEIYKVSNGWNEFNHSITEEE